MKRSILVVALISFSLGLGYWLHWRIHGEVWEFAELGTTRIFSGGKDIKRVFIIVSDDPRATLARSLRSRENLVAQVSFQQYRQIIAKSADACVDPVTLFDVFYQQLEQRYHSANFIKPIVIGEGDASPFVYALLAAAPKNMFAAGVSSAFSPQLNLPKPICGHGWSNSQDHLTLPENASLSGPWFVTFSPTTDKSRFTQSANVHELKGKLEARVVQQQIEPVLNAVSGDSNVEDLPLIELPATATRDYFAIVLSGDGGWADLDKRLADGLVERGVPTIGVNVLQYLWRPKTPEGAASDLQRIITHYQKVFERKNVIVIGFSLGADIAPLMVKQLPAAERANVIGVALLSPGLEAHYEFHLTEWWRDGSEPDTPGLPLLPAIESLTPTPVLCVYGLDEEKRSVCPTLKGKHVIRKGIIGGHHFDGDYPALIELLAKIFPGQPLTYL